MNKRKSEIKGLTGMKEEEKKEEKEETSVQRAGARGKKAVKTKK